jgi:hypothetical protein
MPPQTVRLKGTGPFVLCSRLICRFSTLVSTAVFIEDIKARTKWQILGVKWQGMHALRNFDIYCKLEASRLSSKLRGHVVPSWPQAY